MIDTLREAKKLEEAGFAPEQAAAIVEIQWRSPSWVLRNLEKSGFERKQAEAILNLYWSVRNESLMHHPMRSGLLGGAAISLIIFVPNQMEVIAYLQIGAFLTILSVGIWQLFAVAFGPIAGQRHPRHPKAPKNDLDTGDYHGPPDYRQAMWELSVEQMGWSAYTATIRGILEGPGTEQEKEIAHQKFIAACELGPAELALAAELKARASRQPHLAPWQQG